VRWSRRLGGAEYRSGHDYFGVSTGKRRLLYTRGSICPRVNNSNNSRQTAAALLVMVVKVGINRSSSTAVVLRIICRRPHFNSPREDPLERERTWYSVRMKWQRDGDVWRIKGDKESKSMTNDINATWLCLLECCLTIKFV